MDRARHLCDMERFLLEECSRRSTRVLSRQMLFRIVLRPLQGFLHANVDKEVEKDRQVILHAASLVQAGTYPTQQDVQHLLDVASDIDQAFLEQTVILPMKLAIQYPLIEPIRRQRIQSLLYESHQLLRQWQQTGSLRKALALQYDAQQFSKLLYDILHLYGLETRLLSHAARLPGILAFTRDSLSQTVYVAMEAVARQLAGELAARLFRASRQNDSMLH